LTLLVSDLSIFQDHALQFAALELFASELLLLSLAGSPQFRVSVLVFCALEGSFFFLKNRQPGCPKVCGEFFFFFSFTWRSLRVEVYTFAQVHFFLLIAITFVVARIVAVSPLTHIVRASPNTGEDRNHKHGFSVRTGALVRGGRSWP
jgi:hypothetical protein